MQILPLVALAVAALTVTAIVVAGRHQKDAVYGEMQQLIDRQAQVFETQAAAGMTTARDLAATLEGDPRHDRAASGKIVTRMAERHPELYATWVAFAPDAYDGRDRAFAGVEPHSDVRGQFALWANRPGGDVVPSAFTDTDADSPWTDEDYYKVPLTEDREFIPEPYLDTGVMMTSYTVPIRRAGKPIGVAGVDVTLASLDAQTRAVRVLDSGYAFVTAKSGLLVSFPARKGWAGKKTLKVAAGEAKDPASGRDVVVFTAPIKTGGWTFAAVAPKDEILASIHALRTTLALIGLAALLVIGGALVLVARRIAQPVREVAEAAERVAAGELDVVTARGDDEVGRMGAAFTSMAGSLRQQAEVASAIARGDLTRAVEPRSERDTLGLALRDMGERLRAMVGELSGAAGTLSAASGQLATTSTEAGRAVDEIAEAVTDVAAGAERQVRVVEAVRRSGEDVSEAARTGAAHAEGTVLAAARARGVAESGAEAAADASAAMDAVRAAVEEATSAIRDLGARSERIGGIAATITGIAEQTNLLALNAAIEAARAGESGKGFAVVADEVRGLAEEAQTAAGGVAAIIAEIQAETTRTSALVEEGARRSDDGVAIVREAAGAFAAIREGIGDVDRQAEQIAAAIASVERSAATMGRDLSEVASVAESSSASTQEVSASAQQTSASAQEIAAAAHDLARQAERLDELVGQFTLA
ncbi:methyl-accepting chemotaxis protein [Solirubrobacter pauli]|uniref:methyl-accepting chemotaxis protein n=1 Tax=Solirubrobacter pauli TaxID=166793 RepID=UPI000EB573A5|nr:methyl-accepting chemotaxis protein [Solirubrobacter pauli]